jgi:hypothetical protein
VDAKELGARLATSFSGCGGNKLGLGWRGMGRDGARGVRARRLGASGVCTPTSLNGLGRATHPRVVMGIVPQWLGAPTDRSGGPSTRGDGSHPAVVQVIDLYIYTHTYIHIYDL